MMMFENKKFQQQNDQSHQEHENGDPVDPMHIPHPLRIRCIRIPLLDIKVFLDLSPNSHRNRITSQRYTTPASHTPIFELFILKSSIFALPIAVSNPVRGK